MKLFITLIFSLVTILISNVTGKFEKFESENLKKIKAKAKAKITKKSHHKQPAPAAGADVDAATIKKLSLLLRKLEKLTPAQLPAPNITSPNLTNISSTFAAVRNETYKPLDMGDILEDFRDWDYKLLSHEIQDVFQYMLFRNENRVTQDSLRIFYEKFVKEFKKCDLDANNLWNYNEFLGCMKNETNFRYIHAPTSNLTAFSPAMTDPNIFWYTIFNTFDKNLDDHLNFDDYMLLRLINYSWKQCSSYGPYLTEVAFECSIQIASGLHSPDRTKIKNIYTWWLKTVQNENMRNFDFASFSLVAMSMRLYTMIDKSNENDLTSRTFEVALDQGTLPPRYNQDIINNFFSLVQKNGRDDSGIDVLTFLFYDYHLRTFANFAKSRPFFMNKTEFIYSTQSIWFPNKTRTEMELSPQYNMTKNSYDQFAFANMSHFFGEDEFLRQRFSQVEKSGSESSTLNLNTNSNKNTNKEKSNLKNKKFKMMFRTKKTENNEELNYIQYARMNSDRMNYAKPNNLSRFDYKYNITFMFNRTYDQYFRLFDTNHDGFMEFYDFANLLQLGHIFGDSDLYVKGQISSERLIDATQSYSTLPTIGQHVTDRVSRLTAFSMETYWDFFSYCSAFRIDDLVHAYFREEGQSTIYEVEIKDVMQVMLMDKVPFYTTNQCLRGMDGNNIPLYDWECCFKLGMKGNLEFYGSMNLRQTGKLHNLTIVNTAMYEVDPQYA
jgi:hypothetical protein